MAIIEGTVLSEVPAITIAEQTGDRRTLTLTERALPYRPITFAGVQRSEATSYAGNPIRTLQVLGPDEDPSEWSGTWKDRFIGDAANGNAPAYFTKDGQRTNLLNVIDLTDLVDDIRRKGQEVVVQWGPRVRRGLLKRFEQKWQTIHDVGWTMQFEWISQNDPDVPAVIARDTDYAGALGTLKAKVQQLDSLVDDADDLAADKKDAYKEAVDKLDALVQQFEETTDNALDTTIPVVDQSRRVAGIMSSIAGEADAAADNALSSPAVTQVATASGPGTGPALAVESFITEFTRTLRDTKFTAFQVQQQTLKSLNPDLMGVYYARAEADLRDVSTKFYRTPDEWRSLLVFNDLASSRLQAGDTVFVPIILRPLDGSQ